MNAAIKEGYSRMQLAKGLVKMRFLFCSKVLLFREETGESLNSHLRADRRYQSFLLIIST